MPNWVTNNLYIKSENSETTEKVMDFLNSEENGEIDFNNIVEMPRSLNITSGGHQDQYIKIYLDSLSIIEKADIMQKLENTSLSFYGNYANKIANIKEVSEETRKDMELNYKEEYKILNPLCLKDVGKGYIDNILQYGSATWYDWNSKNWGTKWNACEANKLSEDAITFNTAWSCVIELINKLSILFPTVTFVYEFADEDFGQNLGRFTILNGETINSVEPEYGSEEAYSLAEEILGYDGRYYEEEEEDETE